MLGVEPATKGGKIPNRQWRSVSEHSLKSVQHQKDFVFAAAACVPWACQDLVSPLYFGRTCTLLKGTGAEVGHSNSAFLSDVQLEGSRV